MSITLMMAAMATAPVAVSAPAVMAAQAPAKAVQSATADERTPAQLLNRGFTLAMQGRTEEARAMFLKVREMRVDYTLETSDGDWVYPPDLARVALARLDRGELRARTFANRN